MVQSPRRVTNQTEVEAIFREEVPSEMAQHLVLAIRDGYRKAYDSAFDKYDYLLARRAYPVERQWQLEQSLIAIGERHGLDGAAAHVRHTSRSKTPHVVLTIGRLAFTIAKTDEEDERPRASVYRQSYQLSQQLVMSEFADLLPAVPDDAPKLEGIDVYFVIKHGPDPRDQEIPAFVCATVYDANGTTIGSVNLVEEARSVATAWSDDSTVPTPQVVPTVRSRKSKKEEERSQ